jgi:Carboxypeptidase regulatory-like domain
MKNKGRKTALVLLVLLMLVMVALHLGGAFEDVQVKEGPAARVDSRQINGATNNPVVQTEAAPEKKEVASPHEAEQKPVVPTPPVDNPAEKTTAPAEPQPVPETPIQGSEPKEAEKYVIGRVVDGDTNEGVDSAQVFAATTRELVGTVTTNNKGRFRITGIPATNKIRLLARREGFLSPLDYVEAEIAFGLKPLPKNNPSETGTEPRAVFADARDIKFTWADLSTTPVEIVIRIYRNVQVQGQCQDEAGNPVKGAFVSAKLLEFGGHVEVRSGPGGEFTLGSFPGGRRTLEISASNAGKEWGSCTILELGYPAQPWKVFITLRRKASINCKFVPLDPNSKTSFLVQIKTEHSTYPGSSVNSPAWGCGLNGFVEIGERFMIVVVEMRDPKLGMGPVVAQSAWITAQQETEVVVHEQLRTRVEASLDGLNLDWNEIAEVTLTTGPLGSVTGSSAMIDLPKFGASRTSAPCQTLVTETAEASFVAACYVRFKPKPAREPLVFVSQPLTGAPGSTVSAELKPVSSLLGNLTVTVSNRDYGYVVVTPLMGRRCVRMQLSLIDGKWSAPLADFIEGQYRVWWLPSNDWKFATPPAWAGIGVVKAGQTGQLEIVVPD